MRESQAKRKAMGRRGGGRKEIATLRKLITASVATAAFLALAVPGQATAATPQATNLFIPPDVHETALPTPVPTAPPDTIPPERGAPLRVPGSAPTSGGEIGRAHV